MEWPLWRVIGSMVDRIWDDVCGKWQDAWRDAKPHEVIGLDITPPVTLFDQAPF